MYCKSFTKIIYVLPQLKIHRCNLLKKKLLKPDILKESKNGYILYQIQCFLKAEIYTSNKKIISNNK